VTTVLDLATQRPLGHVTTEAIRAGENIAGDVALSPDGKLIARTGLPSRFISIWDVETGRKVRDIPAMYLGEPTFTPDGTGIAAIHDFKQVSVWRVANGREVRNVKAVEVSRGSVHRIAFSPDGSLLAAAATDGVRVFDAKTGRKIVWIEQDDAYYGSGAVAVNAASNCVAAAETSRGQPVFPRLWAIHGGVERAPFKPQGGFGVSISSDGSLFATCGGELWIWDVESGREIAHDVDNWSSLATLVAFSADAKRIVTAGYRNVKVWDLIT
jgi:WD40 repeat protein